MIDFEIAEPKRKTARKAPRRVGIGANSVGTLPSSACSLSPDAPVRAALDAMNADQELTGIIVSAPGERVSVLSRGRLFETLGRPYGVAVFMNRPVSELLADGPEPCLIVDAAADVGDAVRAAMNRGAATRYEPIVVDHLGSYRLVDLRALLLAQSRLLEASAAMVARQSELALALSGTLDLDALLALVLEGIGELVPYERAVIYMTDGEGLVKAAERVAAAVAVGGEAVGGDSGPPAFAKAGLDQRLGDDGWATFPLAKGDQSLGYLCIKRAHGLGPRGWRDIVSSFAASAALAVANARTYARLEEMAATDQLTGLLNRRAFMEVAGRYADRAALEGRSVAAVMLDLDRFKRVNDTFGHAAGDAVLKCAAARVVSELRAGDLAGRFGGEEFVFLIADAGEAAAGAAAERIRSRLAATPMSYQGVSIPMTGSLGIATSGGPGESLASLIDRADGAMYAAKRAGRNRVRFAEPARSMDRLGAGKAADYGTVPRRRLAEKVAVPAGDASSEVFLKSISSVLSALSLGAPFSELAALALDGIGSIGPGAGAAVFIKTQAGDALRLVAHRGLPDGVLGETVGLGFSLAGRAALERRVVSASMRSVKDVAPRLASIMEDRGFSRYRAFPLTAPGSAIGVLEVFDKAEDAAHAQGLSALAGALGAAASFAGLLDDARRSTMDLEAAYDSTLEAWVKLLELRDQETEGHSRRVTAMTVELAAALGIPSDAFGDYRRGALLHDIGKMGVPDSILLKPGSLSAEERATMSLHPVHAFEVIKGVPFLKKAAEIPYCHHERWDGTGYPRGLSGREIPLAARIFAVVDVWDALRSDRPYREAMAPEESAAIIAGGSGSQFDPDVVAAFLDLRRDEILG